MSRKLVVLIAIAGLFGGLLLSASHRAVAEDKTPKSDLSKAMEQIDDGMKKLRRSLRSKDNDAASLETIANIEQAALAAKSMTPRRATTMPSDQQPPFVAEYRKEMAALVISMCNMETAILDGDNAKAQDIYKQMKQQEEDGHDQFMPEDDDTAPGK
jgi:Cytochrome b562